MTNSSPHTRLFTPLLVAAAIGATLTPLAFADHHNDSQQSSASENYREDESPGLGVVVDSTPGGAVFVMATVAGSPADQAGISHGDYIVSVDQTKVTSPKQLCESIAKMKPGKQVDVTVWRQGDESKKTLTLASEATEPPKNDKAFLGVMLSPTQAMNEGDRSRSNGNQTERSASRQGAMIERAMRRSPAAEAGLQSGDVIVMHGGDKIDSVESFIESIEEMGPGSELQLTILRDGKKQKKSVKLGSLDNAPMRFLRQAMGQFRNDSWSDSPSNQSRDDASDMTDDSMDQMRQRIRKLEEQVRELTGKSRGGNVGSDDLSQRMIPNDQNGSMLVMQFGNRLDRLEDRFDFDRNDRYNRFDRDWDDNNWRNRYYRGYRAPLSRSPRYGNSYYRYGGRPYYNRGFGRNYGYGRSGFRIGNFGVSWY